jgi:hypothetical protein
MIAKEVFSKPFHVLTTGQSALSRCYDNCPGVGGGVGAVELHAKSEE